MHRLLLLSAVVSSAASQAPPCPLPADVLASDYPSPWAKGGLMDKWKDGANDWIKCPDHFIAKLTADSKAFSFGSSYYCNSTSGKWMERGSKFQAPAFVSPVTYPTGTAKKYCPITHTPSNGASGWIALYSGHEQYCPAGEIPTLATDGKISKSITCQDNGKLSIVAEDGSVTYPFHPTLKCIRAPPPPPCPPLGTCTEADVKKRFGPSAVYGAPTITPSKGSCSSPTGKLVYLKVRSE
ncbi:hypothetical protein PMAYCL1PPCAC_05369, partial [Pristionchus mayeri]